MDTVHAGGRFVAHLIPFVGLDIHPTGLLSLLGRQFCRMVRPEFSQRGGDISTCRPLRQIPRGGIFAHQGSVISKKLPMMLPHQNGKRDAVRDG